MMWNLRTCNVYPGHGTERSITCQPHMRLITKEYQVIKCDLGFHTQIPEGAICYLRTPQPPDHPYGTLLVRLALKSVGCLRDLSTYMCMVTAVALWICCCSLELKSKTKSNKLSKNSTMDISKGFFREVKAK